ncbi:MAG TPA: CRTAC1 family protein [Vicinamibacterales bacterium]|nr:CRTAC1 family protein [Vicinamibacterales bacterium]
MNRVAIALFVAAIGGANQLRQGYGGPPELYAKAEAPPYEPPAAAQTPLFVDGAATSGLNFTHVNGASGQYYMAEQMGSGAALFDYDGDGDLDVFLVQGGALETRAAGGAAGPASRLFRNDLTVANGKRVLRFTDVTERSGLALRTYGMGAAVADYDNDGDLDLLVTSFGPETLFRNNGDGTFTDATASAGISDPLWSTSAAFLDYDRDGDLDLFVANYLDFTIAANTVCHDAVGARDYCSPRSYRPVPDRLYRNDGNDRFTDVSAPAGIDKADGAGLGVTAGDYNADGWLDLYVANDANPNQLWINQRDGTFADQGLLSGSAVNAAGNPEGSMGIASGDFDVDGDEDLFITNIAGETFVLYANDGRGNFDDVRVKVGLAAPTAASTGFGTDWFDYDNDGLLDLFIANGAVNVIESQRGQPQPFRMKNQLFRNAGGTFVETTADAGPAGATPNIARGAAFGDIDNDGDVDVLVTRSGGAVSLLLNQAATGRHWIQIRAEQPQGNRFAFGAWIGVERPDRPTLWRRVKTDGSYLSASDSRVHVGLGASSAISGIVVQWPDGTRERFAGPAADRLVTLTRGRGQAK